MKLKILDSIKNAKRSIAVFNGEVRYIDSSWQDELAAIGLSLESNWAEKAIGDNVSESDITNCFKINLSGGRSIFFKRYTYPKSKQSRYWMRASKAQVEVYGYQQLEKLGIPSMNVIGFGEQRSYGKLVSAYIITEGINDSMDLQQFAADIWIDLPKDKRSEIYLQIKNQIFNQLANAHSAHFFHQDLHWRNILITNHNNTYLTTWIDCPRAAYRKMAFNSKHGQMVDLSCLGRRARDYLSRSERYHALQEYLTISNNGWTQRKLFKEIESHHRRSSNPPKSLLIKGSRKQFKP